MDKKQRIKKILRENFLHNMRPRQSDNCSYCPISNVNTHEIFGNIDCYERAMTYGFNHYSFNSCNEAIKFWEKVCFQNTLMETE